MKLLHARTDGIHQMGLAHSAGSVYKEGVESLLAGILGDRESDAARQLVAHALDEVPEVLLHVETGVQILGCSCRLNYTRRLVGGHRCTGLLVQQGRFVTLHIHGLLAGHLHFVLQVLVGTEHLGDSHMHDSPVVTFQILIEETGGNEYREFLPVLVIGLEADRLKPCVEPLLVQVVPDNAQAFLPLIAW